MFDRLVILSEPTGGAAIICAFESSNNINIDPELNYVSPSLNSFE